MKALSPSNSNYDYIVHVSSSGVVSHPDGLFRRVRHLILMIKELFMLFLGQRHSNGFQVEQFSDDQEVMVDDYLGNQQNLQAFFDPHQTAPFIRVDLLVNPNPFPKLDRYVPPGGHHVSLLIDRQARSVFILDSVGLAMQRVRMIQPRFGKNLPEVCAKLREKYSQLQGYKFLYTAEIFGKVGDCVPITLHAVRELMEDVSQQEITSEERLQQVVQKIHKSYASVEALIQKAR